MPLLRTAALLALTAASLGCHTVSSSLIVPEPVEVSRTIGGSVRIDAEGSDKQGMFGPSIIDAEGLRSALTETVLACGLFDEVADAGRHRLRVEVVELVEPEVGFDTHCEVTVRWTLQDGEGARTLWMETITTSATMNSYEEMDSSLRPQLVMEKALRDNLSRGVQALASGAPAAH